MKATGFQEKHLVYIPQEIPVEGIDFLNERGYQLKFGTNSDERTMFDEISDCDAVLLRTARITSKIISNAEKLKVIGRNGGGVDNIDMDAATRAGIYVTYAPLSNTTSVAERALGLIITLSHRIMACDRIFKEKRSFDTRDSLRGQEVRKKKLGIIGLGRIGLKLAEMADRGLGMDIIGYDPLISSNNIPPFIKPINSLDEILKSSDFISLHIPFSEATKRLIGKKELSLIKPSAYLINTARGGIIDESSLVFALKEGIIAGAGIDVFETEPPLEDNPLFHMDNVILSPHIAGVTKESIIQMTLHAAIGIDEVLNKRQITWPANAPTDPRIDSDV